MKKAFTLAEVLITLTIIGVVAAITIPNLTRKWSDHADVQRVKEAYSILSNAYKIAIAENGPFTEWKWPKNKSGEVDNSENFGLMLSKYLKIKQYCGKNLGCFDSYKVLNGKSNTVADYSYYYAGKLIMSNGMRVAFYFWDNPYDFTFNDSYIIVDINGKKAPNRAGYDIFYFGIKENGLVQWANRGGKGSELCNIQNNSLTYNNWSGFSCSYWVIKHGNMDYKYRDVSAEW